MESRVTRKCHARFGERDRETRTSQGVKVRSVPTPFSPLLANIALHGLEERMKQFAVTLDLRYPKGSRKSKRDKIASLDIGQICR
jgi:hypothetical protein